MENKNGKEGGIRRNSKENEEGKIQMRFFPESNVSMLLLIYEHLFFCHSTATTYKHNLLAVKCRHRYPSRFIIMCFSFFFFIGLAMCELYAHNEELLIADRQQARPRRVLHHAISLSGAIDTILCDGKCELTLKQPKNDETIRGIF